MCDLARGIRWTPPQPAATVSGMPAQPPLVAAAARLREQVAGLAFAAPVECVYNPLDYAWEAHREYLERYGGGRKRVVFLGMNPGPWGMAQTGVPFGEVAAVRDWMGINTTVAKPDPEHPKRPVQGFACRRSEVSGRRLWGLFAARFPNAAAFFRDHFVLNYCPLVWMEAGGRNRTPDKLPPAERAAVEQPCMEHLRAALAALAPDAVVGIGGYAEGKLQEAGGAAPPWQIARIPHPSPANPAANRDWPGAAAAALAAAGLWSDPRPGPAARPVDHPPAGPRKVPTR
jgi:single-strand selective monofunctional uracil DNA glycosylase